MANRRWGGRKHRDSGKTSADELCTFVLHLAHGQIVASGTTRPGKSGQGSFALLILGGTNGS
jgi:hypothetical protein